MDSAFYRSKFSDSSAGTSKTAIKALLIPFLYMKIHFHFITDAVVLPVAITAIQGENNAIQAIPKETRRYGGKQ